MDELADITPAERRFLARTLAKARALDPYTRGLFAECVVVEALGPGATLSDDPVAPCDVEWRPKSHAPPITIAVRCTGTRSYGHFETTKPFAGAWAFPQRFAWIDGKWSPDPAQRCRADVAVLALHDGFDLATGWTFFVLPGPAVERWSAKVLTPSTLRAAGHEPVDIDGLAAKVAAAYEG